MSYKPEPENYEVGKELTPLEQAQLLVAKNEAAALQDLETALFSLTPVFAKVWKAGLGHPQAGLQEAYKQLHTALTLRRREVGAVIEKLQPELPF